MFSMIPWKKRSNDGQLSVHHAEPSRQDVGYHSLDRFHDKFDTVLNRLFDNGRIGSPARIWDGGWFDRTWDFGWEDREKEFVFRAELPGFEPEDIDVTLTGNTLTVRAERRDEQTGQNGGMSYHYGTFDRRLRLPAGVDQSKVDANYHSGVLEVHLPKTEQAPGKRIPVNAN